MADWIDAQMDEADYDDERRAAARDDLDDGRCSTCGHDYAEHDPDNDQRCSFGCTCFVCPVCEEKQPGGATDVDGHPWCDDCVANREYDRQHAEKGRAA